MTHGWESEAAIGEVVVSLLRELGWNVYAETHGFDIFAVATTVADCPVGRQMGVELKLDAGTLAGWTKLCRQIIPCGEGVAWKRARAIPVFRKGPEMRLAVSTRFADPNLLRDAGILVVHVSKHEPLGVATWRRGKRRKGPMVAADRAEIKSELAMLALWNPPLHPGEPLPVPELEIDVPAGVPSPKTASAWKIKVVRAYQRLAAGELLDAVELGGLRDVMWRNGWIVDSGRSRYRSELGGRARKLYAVGAGTADSPPPTEQWPEIVEALRAKDAAVAAGG